MLKKKKVKKRKRIVKKQKQVNRKHGIFYFVKKALDNHHWRTIIGVVLVILIGVSIISSGSGFTLSKLGKYFNTSLQTSLISSLNARISNLQAQIASRRRCTGNSYTSGGDWVPRRADICENYFFKQTNASCSAFGVSPERGAFGSKVCCDRIVPHTQVCDQAIAYLNGRNRIHPTKVVAYKDDCEFGIMCQYYPANGFHAKTNEAGEVILDDEGNFTIEEDCVATRKESACNRPCGGGQKTITGMSRFCHEYEVAETCNIQPCFTETVFN